jgi:proteic killer suppression protein
LLDATKIRHRELRRLFQGSRSKIDPRWVRKIENILASLNVIVSPAEMTLYRCHELKGDRKGTFALHVSPNWRVTFQWSDQGPFDVDLEDYHD